MNKWTTWCVVQAGAILGSLLAKGTLTESQATRHVAEAVRAATSAGGIAHDAQQQLSADMQQAATQQRDAILRQEEEAKQTQQRLADEIAELHNPKVCQMSAGARIVQCRSRGQKHYMQ